MRVAEVPEDYRRRDADMYFDDTDASAGYTFGEGNDQCATYEQASEGMKNVVIVCAEFNNLTSGPERVCSMSKNMEPKVRFITVTRKNRGRRRCQAATTTRARGSGGPFVGRLLQDATEEEENANDLVVTFPQTFGWEEGQANTTGEDEVYPMILSSNTTWEVDACLLLPPGYVLVAVLGADSDEPVPLEGECTQVVVAGEETVLLFQLAEDTLPWTRALKQKKKKKKCDDVEDFHGHIEAIEKKKRKKMKKRKKKKGDKVTIDFDSAVKAGKHCKDK